jgi:hypothetical protein
MCNKIQYPNEQAAKDAAVAMSKRKRESMKQYFCWMCGMWHIMTKGKRKLKAKEDKHKHQLQKDYSFNTLKKYSNDPTIIKPDPTKSVAEIAHLAQQGRHNR